MTRVFEDRSVCLSVYMYICTFSFLRRGSLLTHCMYVRKSIVKMHRLKCVENKDISARALRLEVKVEEK